LSSLILFAINDPDSTPAAAPLPAIIAAVKIVSLLKMCPIAPKPEVNKKYLLFS